MRRRPILMKMLLGISIPVVAVLAAAGYLLSSVAGKTIKEQAGEKLAADSVAVSSQVGVFGYDIKLSHLSTMMSGYKIGEQGFLILCTDAGQVIYHPDADEIQKDISEIGGSENVAGALKNQRAGNISYTIDGRNYSGAVCAAGNTGSMVLNGLPARSRLDHPAPEGREGDCGVGRTLPGKPKPDKPFAVSVGRDEIKEKMMGASLLLQ